MPFDGKLSTDRFYPVTLYTSGMKNVNSININSIIVKYFESADTAFTKYTPASADWVLMGNGKYKLNIGAGEFSKLGTYEITVTAAGGAATIGNTFIDYNFVVDVRPYTMI
jgi:hypothetical protein